MGLTQKLGTIPLAIFTDASNNIGIGGSPSGSYKFEVTGTGNFTGALRTASSSFPLDIYGTTNNYGLRINNVQAATLLLYSSNANSSNRNWGVYTNSEVYGDFDIRQSNAKDGDMTIGANSTSRLYIKNNGFIGMGTNSPAQKLHVDGDMYLGNNRNIYLANTGVAAGAIRFYNATSGTTKSAIGSYYNVADEGDIEFLVSASLLTKFIIRSNGRSIFNSTTDRGYQLQVNGDASSYACEIRQTNDVATYDLLTLTHEATSGNRRMVIFNTGGIGTVGTIISTNSSTTYNTSSDYRLKEDLRDFDGLSKVSSIKVYDFKWKIEDSRTEGVLAHELQEVIPYAVYGEKDEVDENGKPKMQGVDYSKLVPVLIKAIQELNAKVSALENKA